MLVCCCMIQGMNVAVVGLAATQQTADLASKGSVQDARDHMYVYM